MRYRQTYLLGCAVMALGYASMAYPVSGFDGSEAGRSGRIADIVRCLTRCDSLAVPNETCDGCSDVLRDRPGVPAAAAATARGHLPEWGPAGPLPGENTPDEAAILLCLQYVIALQQCFMALQGIKNEREQLHMFRWCLEGRYFPIEPAVCRRNLSPLSVPAK
jgi:hypothetical protein